MPSAQELRRKITSRLRRTPETTASLEKKELQTRLADGLKAVDSARNQLSGNKTPLEIAKALVVKYPSLAPVMGVNSYLLKDLTKDANLLDVTNPKVYTYEASNVGQPLFDTLYSMKTAGQIKKSVSENQSGANVIKLIKANTNSKYNTYEAWLSAKKSSLANIVYTL
jgi:hypothetical protein